MSKKYIITEDFKGYRSKRDPSKMPQSGYLVPGSKNVLSTDGENIALRKGYSLFGQACATDNSTPIASSFDWDTNTGREVNLRSYDEFLQFYDRDSGQWVTIKDGWTSVNFRYAVWWASNHSKDIVVFVNGDSNLYAWSGAYAKIGVTTANTIQLLDTTSTWAEERFNVNGVTPSLTNKIIINGTTYTYTGGEGTDTLTGVTPNPTGEASGSLAIQDITTTTNKPASSATEFPNDYISVLNNQLWIGSSKSNEIYISKALDYNDFTFSSPRLPGEGALLYADSRCVGFAVNDDLMHITAGKSQWYKAVFELSADLTKESIFIKRLKTGALQGAYSQEAIGYAKNNILFMSNEPTFDTLGRIENIDTTQAVPISDPIKPDFEELDLTNMQVKFFRNRVYISIPSSNLVYIYNNEREFWEAPQILPVRCFSIIDGELYGHNNSCAETYKLFDGHNDNTFPISAKAVFAYENFGDRVNLKNFDEHYSEGKMSSNTVIKTCLKFEYDGFEAVQEFEIKGNDNAILFGNVVDNSLGKNPLGEEPLADTEAETSETVRFRQIDTTKKVDFHELQVVYESDGVDYQWELLAYGQNVQKATSMPVSIKK